MFFVYVLQLKNDRFYIGYTNNVLRRLSEHQRGQSRSTRYLRPVRLVYFEIYSNRLEAAQRERFLKTGQGRNFIKSLV